jgi:enoyl-CoA hydratase/carnithine racemase
MTDETGAEDRVTMSIIDGIADVRLNRPDKRNALDTAMFVALAKTGERLKSESGVRVVVLSGEGETFCAGLDFSSFQAMAGGGDENDRSGTANIAAIDEGRITHLGQQASWVWQEVPVPVIAAVHGHALGGGFQIALGADIRVAHPGTKWSLRELHWGLTPDMTGTLTLTRLVRPDIAKELTFTARLIDGREAAEIGLVTRLSENPREDALALATEIAGRSPGAVRGAKALFNRLVNAGAAEQFAEERSTISAQIGTPNQIEAVTANFENRPPKFND